LIDFGYEKLLIWNSCLSKGGHKDLLSGKSYPARDVFLLISQWVDISPYFYLQTLAVIGKNFRWVW